MLKDDFLFEDEENELEDGELYFDPNEDMEAYYDFNLLDLLDEMDDISIL